MPNFTLTRPKTSAGEADYFIYLQNLTNKVITGNEIRQKRKCLTYQALRENNLIIFNKDIKAYEITENGRMYVGIVNSSNVVSKKLLKAIMEAE